MINIALLGFGAVGQEVYKQLTQHFDYGTKFIISRVQIRDLDKGRGVYQNGPTFSNNAELLLRDSRYDTVIDCTEYNEASEDLIFQLLMKGITLHTCSKEQVWTNSSAMIKLAKSFGSKIIFNSIPASAGASEYSDIHLTEENYEEHESEAIYSFRGADATITANYIVKDIVRQASK